MTEAFSLPLYSFDLQLGGHRVILLATLRSGVIGFRDSTTTKVSEWNFVVFISKGRAPSESSLGLSHTTSSR